MKKQQLRDCFDKVKPREEIVRTTLDKIHEVRQKAAETPRGSTANFGFVTRLATSACALVILVAIGVPLGRNVIKMQGTSPGKDERMSRPDTQNAAEPYKINPNTATIIDAGDIIARARAQGGDWAVAEAEIDAFYFLELTDEQIAAGISQSCGVALRTKTLVETNVSEEHALSGVKNGEMLIAKICFTNPDDASQMINSVGSSVLVRLHMEETNGESIWIIEEFNIEDVPVE